MQQYEKKMEVPSDEAATHDVPSEQLKAALAEANVYVFRQDAHLRYLWASAPMAFDKRKTILKPCAHRELLPFLRQEKSA